MDKLVGEKQFHGYDNNLYAGVVEEMANVESPCKG